MILLFKKGFAKYFSQNHPVRYIIVAIIVTLFFSFQNCSNVKFSASNSKISPTCSSSFPEDLKLLLPTTIYQQQELTLTIKTDATELKTIEFNFDDQSDFQSLLVTDESQSEFNLKHVYKEYGTYNLALNLTHKDGATECFSQMLDVLPASVPCSAGQYLSGDSCVSCSSINPGNSKYINPGVSCSYQCTNSYSGSNCEIPPGTTTCNIGQFRSGSTCLACGIQPTNTIYMNPGVSCDTRCSAGYTSYNGQCVNQRACLNLPQNSVGGVEVWSQSAQQWSSCQNFTCALDTTLDVSTNTCKKNCIVRSEDAEKVAVSYKMIHGETINTFKTGSIVYPSPSRCSDASNKGSVTCTDGVLSGSLDKLETNCFETCINVTITKVTEGVYDPTGCWDPQRKARYSCYVATGDTATSGSFSRCYGTVKEWGGYTSKPIGSVYMSQCSPQEGSWFKGTGRTVNTSQEFISTFQPQIIQNCPFYPTP